MNISREEAICILQESQENLKLGNILLEDVRSCTEMLESHKDIQFARRTFVRTTFSAIEGLIVILKQTALNYDGLFNVKLTEAERLFLKEESLALKDTGEVKIQKAKISLRSNIRLAFRAYAHMANLTCTLKVDDNGWDSFQDGVTLRDRLTHPKKLGELTLSDKELETVSIAFVWFTGEYNRFKAAFNNRINLASKEEN